MPLETLLIRFGLPLVFVGGMLQGDVTALAGGLLANQGYFSWLAVVLVVAAGSYVAQLFLYGLGFFQGAAYLAKRPHWQARLDQLLPRFAENRGWLVASFRFMYGLRSVIAFGLGATRYPPGRFILINALGAVVWAVVVASVGYGSGLALTTLLAHLGRLEALATGLLAAAGLLSVGLVVWRRRRGSAAGRGPRP